MPRIQLFEFEDQKWFPGFLRDYLTDFLQFIANKADMYKPLMPVLERALERSGQRSIVDLGSGGGGGLLAINGHLLKRFPELRITLTDYYPNVAAFVNTQRLAPNFQYIAEPVDARNVPRTLAGLRTQFLSFHHFNPKDALQILQNSVDSQNSILIVEAQERSVISIVSVLFSPITVMLTSPFIKPFSLGRLVFTYLIPIVPLVALWDGVVSSLRTYSKSEMQALITSVTNSRSYEWEIGRVRSGPGVILYTLGQKRIFPEEATSTK